MVSASLTFFTFSMKWHILCPIRPKPLHESQKMSEWLKRKYGSFPYAFKDKYLQSVRSYKKGVVASLLYILYDEIIFWWPFEFILSKCIQWDDLRNKSSEWYMNYEYDINESSLKKDKSECYIIHIIRSLSLTTNVQYRL